jgi:hypothetical protein
MIIKRLFLAAFILVAVFSSVMVYSEDKSFPYVGVVASEKLRVVPRRGTNFREIAVLSQNDLVTVIDQNGEWLQINPPENLDCWLSADYVSNGVVTGSRVNLRQGAGVNYAVLGQAEHGDKVTVLAEKDGWVKIAPPATISAWVPAEFVKYFSSSGQLSVQLERLEYAKSLFESASRLMKSELSKESFDQIDFSGIRDQYYELIKEYPDTLQARQALFDLVYLQDEEQKRQVEYNKSLKYKRVKELFEEADEIARAEMNKSLKDRDQSLMTAAYMEVVKESPDSEEAKWALNRMSSLREDLKKEEEQAKAQRIEMLMEAEEYRNNELLKEVNQINYDAVIRKYQSIIDSYPYTVEADKAKERIDDMKMRSGEAQSYTPSAKPVYTSPETSQPVASGRQSYTYTGYLVKETALADGGTLYRIEERGFLYKKDLCLVKSYDPSLVQYVNKKVLVTGSLRSLDNQNRPVIDLITLEIKE